MDSVRRPFGRRAAENALRYLGATAGAVSRRCYRGAWRSRGVVRGLPQRARHLVDFRGSLRIWRAEAVALFKQGAGI